MKNMISFNPGPSYIDPLTTEDIVAIAESGFLSQSHRSEQFSEVSREAIEGLRVAMDIPEHYQIFYQPSATAAMETILLNCVASGSFHFVHGAFSRRFYQTSRALGFLVDCHESAWNEPVVWDEVTIPAFVEMITVTHNETSTGLMWPISALRGLRDYYRDMLIAVDVTSSFGAMAMPWEVADIWFGSVQKCLGMPSGLGFVIVSPEAFERARDLRSDVAPWHKFEVMAEKMKNYQTIETPNMLAIALLAKKMERWDLPFIEKEIAAKSKLMEAIANPYVADKRWRSKTVGNFVVSDPAKYHAAAEKKGLILGKGYGPLKPTCVRLANFPQTTREQFVKAVNVLTS